MDNQFSKTFPLFRNYNYKEPPERVCNFVDVYVWEGSTSTRWLSNVDGGHRV